MIMRKHSIFAVIAMMMMCLPLALQAKVEHLLPKVHVLNETKGTPFALQRTVTITDATNSAALKRVFTDNGCTLAQGGATVTVEMVNQIDGAYDYTLVGYDNEGYQLTVTTNAITIKAVKPIGVIRAAQTLAQLAEGYDEGAAAIETVEITDWAAFKLRGYMHDVGRSFISAEELKKHIDLLSRFKVNTFHWHFTENQAWRFEVNDYPQLTSAESMTRFAGKYYTQDQCREVAAYAKERGVTIIPEIDMPGHSAAFKRAMGYGMQTDEGVAVLKEVLTQLAAVFPDAPYIHIGADEEAITYTKDGKGFLEIMAGHIRETLGRKMVVWNPISGVAINKTMCDMTQMWSSRGANINGVPDIDCRYNYTNHFDVFADVVGIYKSNIYYKAQGDAETAGTISAYWNDRKTPTEADIVKQNNMYANVIASAERAWIGGRVDGNEGYIEKTGTTLPNSGEVYEEFKSWEERFLFHKAHSLKGEPIPYVKQTNVRWRITEPFPNGGNSSATFAPDQYATSTNDNGLIPESFTHEGKTYYTGMATGAGIYLRHVWGNNTIPTYYGSTNYSNMTSYAWTYVYSPKAQTVGAQIEFQNYGRSENDKAPDAGKWDRKGSDIWLNGTRIAPPTWDNTGKGINSEVDLGNENFSARQPIAVQLNEGWNKVFIKLPYVGADGVRLNKWMFTFVLTDLEGVNAVEGLIYSPNQCMDEAAELIASKVSEVKRNRASYIGTGVGQWPESAAATLDAKIAEVEATLSATMTAEERTAQATALDAAWEALAPSLTANLMNMPDPAKFYRMCTPQRESRYPTSKGAANDIVGEQTPTNKSVWQFERRTDGSYDIVNAADGTYISPASADNSALKTAKEKPATGWTVKPAATAGLVIITNGSAQFNQTNNSQLGYRLYNWGSGTNTTDTGCQYLVEETAAVEREEETEVSQPTKALAAVFGIAEKTLPYAVESAVAQKVFAQNDLTIAVDVTMPASLANNTRYALVCAADPTQGVTGATKTNSPYIAYGLNGSNPVYLPSSANGDKFTYRDFTAAASTNYKVVYVVNRTNNTLTIYVDGAQKSTATYPVQGYELQSFSNFASNANAKLYIGGGMVSNTTAHDKFSGTIHSVQFFGKALSASEVAAIDYTESEQTEPEEEDVIDTDELESTPIKSVEEFENGGVYTFVTKRGWMGAAQGNNKVISTARTQATPAAAANNKNFQWVVYKSAKGNYYLYNMGKKKFMGVQSANNTEIDFVSIPAGRKLTFKQSGSQEYPIMFSTDKAGVVNHSTNHGGGLINWTGGWNNPDDDGSNHKVTRVKKLVEADLKGIADLVEAYDAFLYVTAEVEGLKASNPNTHYGNIKAATVQTPLKRSDKVSTADYDGTQETTTIEFTRAYRGFEFQGFRVGSQELGKSFELTADIKSSITAENPLVAKFTTTDEVTLFYDDDPFSYRIPAIGKTSTGRLIAVSDYRYSLDDIGRYNFGTATPGIDLVIRTSDNNGKTWSETKTIAKGSCVRGTDDCAYGDAAIAVVGEKVLVMAAAGDVMFGNGSATAHNRAVRLFSEDNGETWTKQDISETLFLNADATINNGFSSFFGSGRLAVDENYNGTGKARIYGALLLKKASGTGNYVIYTDDFGLTWHTLGGSQDPVANQDEPKVEILPSGQILLSVRRSGGRQFNVFTYSDKATNTGSWNSNVNGCGNGGSNTCNGEIYCVDAMKADNTPVKLLLQSQPKGGGGLYDRRDVTIWYKEVTNANYTSEQIAGNWTQGLQVSTQQSAYSAMALQNNGKIAFFFEEAPCFGDDQAKGYCMVYIPLSIEKITGGAYITDPATVGPELPDENEDAGVDLSTLNPQSSTAIYDLMGRKVATMTKGNIYIVGGKKVIVK